MNNNHNTVMVIMYPFQHTPIDIEEFTYEQMFDDITLKPYNEYLRKFKLGLSRKLIKKKGKKHVV